MTLTLKSWVENDFKKKPNILSLIYRLYIVVDIYCKYEVLLVFFYINSCVIYIVKPTLLELDIYAKGKKVLFLRV